MVSRHRHVGQSSSNRSQWPAAIPSNAFDTDSSTLAEGSGGQVGSLMAAHAPSATMTRSDHNSLNTGSGTMSNVSQSAELNDGNLVLASLQPQLRTNIQNLQNMQNIPYTSLTPAQCLAVHQLRQKKTFLGVAETGTGKTLGILIAVVEDLLQPDHSDDVITPRHIIFASTHELAEQMASWLAVLIRGTHIKMLVLHGGHGWAMDAAAVGRLARGEPTQVMIACPGRLYDFVKDRQIKLGGVAWVIMDECDVFLKESDRTTMHDDINKICDKIAEAKPDKHKHAYHMSFWTSTPNGISSTKINNFTARLKESCERVPRIVLTGTQYPAPIVERPMFNRGTTRLNLIIMIMTDIRCQMRLDKRAVIFCDIKGVCDLLGADIKRQLGNDRCLILHSDVPNRPQVFNTWRHAHASGGPNILVTTAAFARGLNFPDIEAFIVLPGIWSHCGADLAQIRNRRNCIGTPYRIFFPDYVAKRSQSPDAGTTHSNRSHAIVAQVVAGGNLPRVRQPAITQVPAAGSSRLRPAAPSPHVNLLDI